MLDLKATKKKKNQIEKEMIKRKELLSNQRVNWNLWRAFNFGNKIMCVNFLCVYIWQYVCVGVYLYVCISVYH